MRNRIHSFNTYNTPIFPAAWLQPDDTQRGGKDGLLPLCAAALLASIAGTAIAWLIGLLLPAIAGMMFLGKWTGNYPDITESGLGWLMMLVVIAGAGVWIFARKRSALAAPSLALAAAAGGPVGMESVFSLINITLIRYLSGWFGISAHATATLLSAAVAGAISWSFGAPVAAFVLALEIFLAELTLATVLPLLIAVIVPAAAHWLLLPVKYDFAFHNSNEYTLLWMYAPIGLLSGLLAVLYRKLYHWLGSLSLQLESRGRWWLLLAAAFTGMMICFYPEAAGPGNDFLLPLLHGAVTLRFLLIMCLVRYLISLLYNAGLDTGMGITNSLLTGAGWGLFTGFIFQVSNPALHVSSSLAALAGMLAMFAGSTRAIMAALVLSVEISAEVKVLPFVAAACLPSYLLSLLFAAVKRKQPVTAA